MKDRATAAEIEQRITAIMPYVMMGKTGDELMQAIKLNPDIKWSIGKRQLANYTKLASDYIKKSCSINRDFEIGKVRYRLEELFKMALKDRDLNQARLILRDYCDLFGLNAPSKMESDTMLKIIIEDA